MKSGMKATLITAALLCAMSSSAYAGQTVEFRGDVTENTCMIDSSKSTSTVNLGRFSANYFSHNDMSDLVDFDINLSECPASANNISLAMHAADFIGDGMIVNQGTATGIYVVVENPLNSQAIPMNGSRVDFEIVPSEGQATIELGARLKKLATGQVSPGSVMASMTYDLVYE